jgi:hypothetical protein
VRSRLAGSDARAAAPVAWGERSDALVINVPSVKVRIKDGWLLCAFDVNRPGEAKASLQLVYFLGRDGQGDDTSAASTVSAGGPGVAIADAWGTQLQRVVWDGVLDALEGVLGQVGREHPARPLDLIGFCGIDDGLAVDVDVN